MLTLRALRRAGKCLKTKAVDVLTMLTVPDVCPEGAGAHTPYILSTLSTTALEVADSLGFGC
jgi:hypothetical protein